MRDYGKIHSSFWTSPDIIKLSDNGKLLAVYLLSCEHSNIVGCFRLPNAYIVEDLNWTTETVIEALKELFTNGFVRDCERSKWLWICNFLTFNKPENPNQWKSARKAVKQIPEQFKYKQELTNYFNQIDPLSETLSEPLSNPLPIVTTETETETETERAKRKRFEPPSIFEVKSYIAEKNLAVSANGFLNFYESKGWMVGKNKMKDWRASIRGWASRDETKNKTAVSQEDLAE